MINGILFETNGFTKEDISQLVDIHRRQIQQGFLGSLGDKALELIFTLAAESEFGVLVIAKDKSNGRVAGFFGGTTHIGAFYRDFLRRKSLLAAIHLAPRLLSPTRLWKAFETLIYPVKRQVTEMPKAQTIGLAVDERYLGKGLAQSLFHEMVDAFAGKGVAEFKILVGEGLIPAQRFFEKMGAEKVARIEVHQGSGSWVYVYKIRQAQHGHEEEILG